jgi:hypothetical protein
MTKTKLVLGALGVGLVLALAVHFWGLAQAQEPPAPGTTGRGQFRLTHGPNGITCYNPNGSLCPKPLSALPKETIVAVRALSIIQTETPQGGDPCYLEFNGAFYPIPC